MAKQVVDKLLKLKPKEYKQISTKEKNETKAKYEYEKAKTEVYKEEIMELENVCFRLFVKIKWGNKEKLIGLCLDRKILNLFDEETEEEDKEE